MPTLTKLAPPHYWSRRYPRNVGKPGVSLIDACADLIEQCYNAGIYNPGTGRGRPARKRHHADRPRTVIAPLETPTAAPEVTIASPLRFGLSKSSLQRLAQNHAQRVGGPPRLLIFATRLSQLCQQTARRMKLGPLGAPKVSLLPYSASDFVARLEATLPLGVGLEQAFALGWQIDHVTPVSIIARSSLTDKQKFLAAVALDNLRMLTGLDNITRQLGHPSEWAPEFRHLAP